ncbi:hypothetical protein ACET3Z_017754 [Daucus carota]
MLVFLKLQASDGLDNSVCNLRPGEAWSKTISIVRTKLFRVCFDLEQVKFNFEGIRKARRDLKENCGTCNRASLLDEANIPLSLSIASVFYHVDMHAPERFLTGL